MDTFELLKDLPHLFSLTFSLSTEKYNTDLVAILETNKLHTDGVIVILQDGFQSLKLLRFSAPILPLLSFSENAMPKLERLELRFRMLEGLFGMDNLKSLQEVHLIVNDKAGRTTRLIIDDLITAAKEFSNKPRVIRDEYYDLVE
jgi:disease resistance protein RPM1